MSRLSVSISRTRDFGPLGYASTGMGTIPTRKGQFRLVFCQTISAKVCKIVCYSSIRMPLSQMTPDDAPQEGKLDDVFDKSLQTQLSKMVKLGGAPGRVAQMVSQLLGNLMLGLPEKIRKTRHGESRIKNCVKYDLYEAYRLITIEKAGHRFWLFVGTHDETDHWIKTHKGLQPLIDLKKKRVTLSLVSTIPEEIPPSPPPQPTPNPEELLFAALPDELVGPLRADPKTGWYVVGVSRTNFDEFGEKLLESESARGHALFDAAYHLYKGEHQQASARLGLHLGTIEQVPEDKKVLDTAFESGANQDNLVRLRDLSEHELKYLLEPSHFEQWMLFLHPDQKSLATTDFEGPARVTGVSGSGKTVLLVHRARHLATHDPSAKILIVTLNKPLATLIQGLIVKLCNEQERKQITVLPMYELCWEILLELGEQPSRMQLLDPLSGEDVRGNSWTDFFTHDHRQSTFRPLLESLENRKGDLDPSLYLRDELIWIRSALGKSERTRYLQMHRTGREIPMTEPRRREILGLLEDWEEWMDAGDLLDPEGVSLRAYELRDRIKANRFRFRYILADEAQDLSTVELSILIRLISDPTNGLFLVGDAAQRVYPRHCSLISAGIHISGRAKVIRKNYRNTRQILEVANAVIQAFPPPKGDEPEGFQLLDPEFSDRTGSIPQIETFDSCDAQNEWIKEEIRRIREMHPDAPICVASPREDTRIHLQNLLRHHGISSAQLDTNSWNSNDVLISDLEKVKGFEFYAMFVCDLTIRMVPAVGLPREEWWRDACHLYVAMTRAREELTLCVVKKDSPLIEPIRQRLDKLRGTS